MIIADKFISSWPTVLRPAPGVQLFLAQDEGILFDEMGQKLFHLNSAAACIWCYIEGTSTVEDLIQSVASATNIDKASARQFVLDMVRTWWRLGLVQGSRRQLSMLRPDLSVGEYAFGSTAIDETKFQAKPLQHHYRLLDAKFYLSYPPGFESILHPILAHLQVQEPARNAICLTITRVGQEWRILQGSGVLGACRDLERLAPLVHGILASLALRRQNYLLALHAGGVARDNQALLLVGKSRSGKTVLTGAMLGEGWDYLSDDMILIERGSLNAKGVPSSLTVKPGGWELLAPRYPNREPPRQHLRADGQVVGYLSPPAPLQSFSLPRAVQWIVFPVRGSNTPDGLQSLNPLEGLQRLMNHCCGIPGALLAGDIRRLIEWSAGIRWLEVTFTDLEAAVTSLESITMGDRLGGR
jgi:hypothetical protein